MDILPQLAVGTAPTGRALNRPFAEEPKEQQIELLYQQMLQQQQLIAVQVMRINSLTTIQESVAAQNTRLQELAVATIRLAEEDTGATKEALAASRQENLAKEARIAELEAQLASQEEIYTQSQAAARQALATQARAMEAVKEQNGILSKALDATEKVLEEIKNTVPKYYLSRTYLSTQALTEQAKERRILLQQNIQNQATEAQNIGGQ